MRPRLAQNSFSHKKAQEAQKKTDARFLDRRNVGAEPAKRVDAEPAKRVGAEPAKRVDAEPAKRVDAEPAKRVAE
jgi:hypothetical protein